MYDKAFDEFCVQIIEKRIIGNNEVLLLGYLLKKFIGCVQTIEKIDVTYQAARLKKRIQTRYPQLIFQLSKTMNKGTLVYADSVTAGDVADTYQDLSTLDSQSEDEDDIEHEVSDNDFGGREDSMTENMYFTALEVKKLLTKCKGVSSEWPPDSQDLTLSLARQSIPVKLYNFLAWCVGFSSDPIKDDRVELSSSEDANIVSIAQDLVYAESKGRKQTHKSLALGMTVRQMTGSVRLLRILHGLGHTASTATVYRHDTALAIASSDGARKEMTIPRNVSANTFTTIVWDNNDFDEETVSGKGTTHVANGIVLQNKVVRPTLREKKTVSKKIAPFHIQKSIFSLLQAEKKELYRYEMKVVTFRLTKNPIVLSKIWEEMLTLYIFYPGRTRLRMGKICQDGLDLIPEYTKKFQVLRPLAIYQ